MQHNAVPAREGDPWMTLWGPGSTSQFSCANQGPEVPVTVLTQEQQLPWVRGETKGSEFLPSPLSRLCWRLRD